MFEAHASMHLPDEASKLVFFVRHAEGNPIYTLLLRQLYYYINFTNKLRIGVCLPLRCVGARSLCVCLSVALSVCGRGVCVCVCVCV